MSDTNLTQLIINHLTRDELHNADFTDHGNELFVQKDHAGVSIGGVGVDALDTTNITNCITNIPQDILVEINDSNGLTLKSGSKLYQPNGSGIFTPVAISGDKSRNDLSVFGSGTYLVFRSTGQFIPGGGLIVFAVNTCVSGSTDPISGSNHLWYDTTNNVIKTYESGTYKYTDLSLPIAVITITNGIGVTSIDQVFNGFGYIGSHNFRLPGLSGLAPNGRNSDGTFKNTKWTLTTVRTEQAASGTGNYMLIGGDTGLRNQNSVAYFEQPTKPNVTNQYSAWYDTENNYIYYTNDTGATWVQVMTTVLGIERVTSGKVDSLYTKQVFQAVDYSDTGYMAHQAMPSGRYINLTASAHGGVLTAPADGWFVIRGYAGSGAYVYLSNTTNGLGQTAPTGNSSSLSYCSLPVKKGDNVTVGYYGGALTMCRFVYANGAQ